MQPEERARLRIDELLSTAGWDSGGNYWNDYGGMDGDGDGVGDTPYILERLGEDECPLMDQVPRMPRRIVGR